MKTGVAIFACCICFVGGWIVRYAQQDAYDKEAKAELGRQAYACSGYLVADKYGDHACRALMPRLEADWMLKPSPLRLRKKEVRKAIAGDFTDLRSNH